jgi:hypothetical protein
MKDLLFANLIYFFWLIYSLARLSLLITANIIAVNKPTTPVIENFHKSLNPVIRLLYRVNTEGSLREFLLQARSHTGSRRLGIGMFLIFTVLILGFISTTVLYFGFVSRNQPLIVVGVLWVGSLVGGLLLVWRFTNKVFGKFGG